MFSLRSNGLKKDHFVPSKMARPRKDDMERRTEQVNIRLTKEESAKVNEYSKASGLSPANWIRTKIFTGRFPSPKLSPIDAAVYQEFKKIGINLNQANHQLNRGEKPASFLIILLTLQNKLDETIKLLLHDRQSNQG